MSDLAVTLTIDQLEALVRKAVREERSAPSVEEPEILTREQAAKMLQVHPNVVSRYVRDLGLPARRVGGEWRLLRSEVLAWVDSRERVKESA